MPQGLPNKRGGAKACRISNKEIYRKLGIENVRHRREGGRCPSCSGGCSRSITFWSTRSFPGFPRSRKRSAFFDSLGIDRQAVAQAALSWSKRESNPLLCSETAYRLPTPKPLPSPTSIRAKIPIQNCAPGVIRMTGFGELCGCTASRSAPS